MALVFGMNDHFAKPNLNYIKLENHLCHFVFRDDSVALIFPKYLLIRCGDGGGDEKI